MRALSRPKVRVLAQQRPVRSALLRQPVVVRVRAQVQLECLRQVLQVLPAQNRDGPVVQVCRAPDVRLDEQGARRLQRQSDERVLGERHLQDGYRLRAWRCHRRVLRRCRRWLREEAVQSGGQDQDLRAQDRWLQLRRRVQDERCDRPMTKVKRRRRRE